MQNRGFQDSGDQQQGAGMGYGAKTPSAQGAYPQQAPQAAYYGQQAPYQVPQQPYAHQPYAPAYAQPTMTQPQPAPAGAQPADPQKPARKKRGKGFIIGVVVAVVALILAAFFVFQYLNGGQSARNAAGAMGQLEGKTPEEIQEELNKMVSDGMLDINILSVIELEDGDSPAKLRIENSPANHYMFNVVITDNATGEVYYESGMLEPNYHIEDGNLLVHLDKGTYPCTATFYAYDLETEDPIGEAAAMVTVEVKN